VSLGAGGGGGAWVRGGLAVPCGGGVPVRYQVETEGVYLYVYACNDDN
jgi:hypothetical protein